jgi:hypothetical protein
MRSLQRMRMMHHTKRALIEKSPQKTLNQLYSGSKQELPLDLTTTTLNSSRMQKKTS